MKNLLLALIVCVSSSAMAVKVGSVLPKMTLSGDEGGLVSGKTFDSSNLIGKVTLIMYVDPDEKNINEALENFLKEQNFPRANYGSVAVINLGATWIPNALINSKLEAKQKKFPNTLYVKDVNKALVKQWGLADDTYAVTVLDKKGQVVLAKHGKLDKAEIKEVAATLWREIKR
jgi:predicted transcriptional regulator